MKTTILNNLDFSIYSAFVFTFALSFAPTYSFAGENCTLRSNGLSHFSEISAGLKKAAWYSDRDNSMTSIPSDEGVGAAQIIFADSGGTSQGVQVAPGCFLIPAHRGNDKRVENINDDSSFAAIIHYPMDPKNMMKLKSSDKMVSPWFNSTDRKATGDYVLVKVDSPLNPNDYIKPIQASDERLVSADINGELSVHLYRGKTVFKTDKNGVPDFIDENAVYGKGLEEYAKIYQSPQRVNTPCQIGFGFNDVLGHDCPTEKSVSGSPYVSNINGKDYLIGMHIQGAPKLRDNFITERGGNLLIQSKHFCKDYKNVCGMECAKLSDVLPEKSAALSI